MKHTVILLLAFLVTASCSNNSNAQGQPIISRGADGRETVVNEPAVMLVSLEHKGKIEVDTDRALLEFLSEMSIIDPIKQNGFDYSFEDNYRKWRLYVDKVKDGEYYIITGNVSKSPLLSALFTCVFYNAYKDKGSEVNVKCFQLGNKTLLGAYPKFIMPYRLGAREQLMPKSRMKTQ